VFNLLILRRSVAAVVCSLLTPFAASQTLTFTQAQVDAGKALYKETCQICHGSSMANGQFGTPLKGSFFQDKWKGKSLGELLTFVYEKMPPDKVMSLTPEQYTGAVAYILSRNDIAVSDTAMSADKAALNSVSLPW
jgi:alcohol dehydrogenase (cytochrome c)